MKYMTEKYLVAGGLQTLTSIEQGMGVLYPISCHRIPLQPTTQVFAQYIPVSLGKSIAVLARHGWKFYREFFQVFLPNRDKMGISYCYMKTG
jgi:hypothetical protein